MKNGKLHIRYVALLAILACIVGGQKLSAQQDPAFTNYAFNLLAVNPGYAGSRDVLTIAVLSRNQWVGFEGAPVTQTLTLHTPMPFQKKVGLGLSLVNDRIGPVSLFTLYGDVTYRLALTRKSRLSVGIKGGINLYSVDPTSLITNQVDNALLSDVQNKFLPNFGLGAYYYTNRYYIGFSSPEVFQNKLSTSVESDSSTLAKERRHYFFMAKYVLDVNRDLKYLPAFLIKAVKGAPVAVDITNTMLIQDALGVGFTYSHKNYIGGLLTYQITRQFLLGYSYDVVTSRLGAYNGGTHEVMVSYDFARDKLKFKTPRYF